MTDREREVLAGESDDADKTHEQNARYRVNQHIGQLEEYLEVLLEHEPDESDKK